MVTTTETERAPAPVMRKHGKACEMFPWHVQHHTMQRHKICHLDLSSPLHTSSHTSHLHNFLAIDTIPLYHYMHHVLDCAQYLAHACTASYHNKSTQPQFPISSPHLLSKAMPLHDPFACVGLCCIWGLLTSVLHVSQDVLKILVLSILFLVCRL